MIPFRTPFFLPYIYPSLTWRIPTESKIIYLTFDDGPIEGPTHFVLNQLREFNAKATFFCIGDNVRKYPEVLLRIHEEKHAIGNHTFNHLNGWKTSNERYQENIRLCDTQLNLHIKSEGRLLFRPPYGRIKFSQLKLVKQYDTIMWDVLTHDYDARLGPKFLLKKSIEATRPGSIVVFHDSLKAKNNLEYILPHYLEHFQNEGFTFDSIR